MKELDIDLLIEESQRIASTIFPKILEENKRLGIATPIGIAGKIYFIMPNGKILTEEEYLLSKEEQDLGETSCSES